MRLGSKIKPGMKPVRVSLRFSEREAFGRFCVALTEDHVPFSHRGFQTLVIDQARFARLPGESRRLFELFSSKGWVEVWPTAAAGKRSIPGKEEAASRLRRFTERLTKAL